MEKAAVPPEFVEALMSLRDLDIRPEIHLTEVPAPTRIAPFALALTAEINRDPNPDPDPDFYLGDGRLVVLHDPAGQPAWNGTFRVITQLSARVEAEMADDPFLGEVTWAWLTDAFHQQYADYHSLSGTVTRVLSETFGGLELHSSAVEVELRASWTPVGYNLAPHAKAWFAAMSSLCGIAPVAEGVVDISSLHH